MPAPFRFVSFGECMLELQGQAFGTMRQTFGGDTLNTAVYFARVASGRGWTVDYASALGEDSLSDGLIERWQAEGLSTTLVRRIADRMPGLYLIEVGEGGERRFSYWRDRSAARAYFEAPGGQTPLEQQAEAIDALYFSGISLAILDATARERLFALAKRLRARGATVVFDNNFRPRLWPDVAAARDAFARAIGIASIALLTLDDECALWGQPSPERQLERTLAASCPEIVVKRGALPTLVQCAGEMPVEVPTERVAEVVDTTAAGDSFAGAYLATRLAGATAERAARAGNCLAAQVVQHRGALIPRAAMPDFGDLSVG